MNFTKLCSMLAARRCYNSGQTVAQIAKSAGKSEAIIRRWLTVCRENRGDDMKTEIEVSEDVLREELQRQAAKMLIDKLGHWQLKDELTKVVNKLWGENVEKVVREELANTDALREKVVAAIERKIQGQLTTLMKKGGSE